MSPEWKDLLSERSEVMTACGNAGKISIGYLRSRLGVFVKAESSHTLFYFAFFPPVRLPLHVRR